MVTRRQDRRSRGPSSLLALILLTACGAAAPPAHLHIAGADAERGRQLIRAHGCGACHRIDGVAGARGLVGPPLDHYAQRALLAGQLPNTPTYLVPWLVDAPAMIPGTGMPDLDVTEAEARDIAAYLYTLGADEVIVWPPEVRPDRPWYDESGRPD